MESLGKVLSFPAKEWVPSVWRARPTRQLSKHTICSRQGCRDVFTWRQCTLTYIARDLVQVSVFCFKECSECEKGESRPLKDRPCLGTPPVFEAFESPVASDGS